MFALMPAELIVREILTEADRITIVLAAQPPITLNTLIRTTLAKLVRFPWCEVGGRRAARRCRTPGFARSGVPSPSGR